MQYSLANGPLRASAVRRSIAIFVLAFCAHAQVPQAPEPQLPQPQRPLPPGVRVDNASTSFGWYSFAQTFPAGQSNNSALPIYIGSADAEISAHIPWHHTNSLIAYRGSYTGNQRYTDLNGFDQALSLQFQTDPSRRTVFIFEGDAESTLIANVLFQSVTLSTTPTRVESPSDLAGTIITDVTGSPLEMFLAGARRKVASAYAQLSRTHNPRLTSSLRTGIIRELRSESGVSTLFPYPSMTLGSIDGRIAYQWSRRTHVGWAANYTRSYAGPYRFDSEAGTMFLERVIGVRSFGRVEGGFMHTAYGGVTPRSIYGYTGSAGIGTTKRDSTFVLSIHRAVGDLHALAANSTIGAEGSWSWARVSSPWSASSSVVYERLALDRDLTLGGWVYRMRIARHVQRQAELFVEAAYATGYSGSLADLTRRGVRIGLVWTPEERRRAH